MRSILVRGSANTASVVFGLGQGFSISDKGAYSKGIGF
jgi:hypothetical protein